MAASPSANADFISDGSFPSVDASPGPQSRPEGLGSSTSAAGRSVSITNSAIDALAVTALSEVGITGLTKDYNNVRGIVDSAINRTALGPEVATQYGNTIEETVDAQGQFTGISKAGGWENYADRVSPADLDTARGLVEQRLGEIKVSGMTSTVVDFANPNVATNPGAFGASKATAQAVAALAADALDPDDENRGYSGTVPGISGGHVYGVRPGSEIPVTQGVTLNVAADVDLPDADYDTPSETRAEGRTGALARDANEFGYGNPNEVDPATALTYGTDRVAAVSADRVDRGPDLSPPSEQSLQEPPPAGGFSLNREDALREMLAGIDSFGTVPTYLDYDAASTFGSYPQDQASSTFGSYPEDQAASTFGGYPEDQAASTTAYPEDPAAATFGSYPEEQATATRSVDVPTPDLPAALPGELASNYPREYEATSTTPYPEDQAFSTTNYPEYQASPTFGSYPEEPATATNAYPSEYQAASTFGGYPDYEAAATGDPQVARDMQSSVENFGTSVNNYGYGNPNEATPDITVTAADNNFGYGNPNETAPASAPSLQGLGIGGFGSPSMRDMPSGLQSLGQERSDVQLPDEVASAFSAFNGGPFNVEVEVGPTGSLLPEAREAPDKGVETPPSSTQSPFGNDVNWDADINSPMGGFFGEGATTGSVPGGSAPSGETAARSSTNFGLGGFDPSTFNAGMMGGPTNAMSALGMSTPTGINWSDPSSFPAGVQTAAPVADAQVQIEAPQVGASSVPSASSTPASLSVGAFPGIDASPGPQTRPEGFGMPSQGMLSGVADSIGGFFSNDGSFDMNYGGGGMSPAVNGGGWTSQAGQASDFGLNYGNFDVGDIGGGTQPVGGQQSAAESFDPQSFGELPSSFNTEFAGFSPETFGGSFFEGGPLPSDSAPASGGMPAALAGMSESDALGGESGPGAGGQSPGTPVGQNAASDGLAAVMGSSLADAAAVAQAEATAAANGVFGFGGEAEAPGVGSGFSADPGDPGDPAGVAGSGEAGFAGSGEGGFAGSGEGSGDPGGGSDGNNSSGSSGESAGAGGGPDGPGGGDGSSW